MMLCTAISLSYLIRFDYYFIQINRLAYMNFGIEELVQCSVMKIVASVPIINLKTIA